MDGSIANNNSYRLTSNKECIYGWYPSGRTDARNEDPKEIYANLGARPPRNQSFCEAEILYNYHQSIKQSELIYRPKQTAEEALKPPWSLNLKTTNDFSENAEKTIPEAFSARRAHSAPALRNAPTHRIILKIPTPQFQNLFDGEAEEYFENKENKNDRENSFYQIDNDNNNIRSPIQITDLLPPEQYKSLNFNETSEVIITTSSSNIESELPRQTNEDSNVDITKRVTIANNYGKKPLIFEETLKQETSARLTQRPKTASANFRRTQSSASIKTNLKVRPKTGITKSKTSLNQSNNFNKNNATDSKNNNINNNQIELKIDNTQKNENTDKTNNLQQIIASHQVNEQPTQFYFNPFYKGTQNLNKQSTDAAVIYVDPAWVDNYVENKNKLKNDIKIIDGHWKDQIINRNKYLQKRPSYFVKVNLDKLKPDPPAPELHYNASETFFYNTLPHRKMTFNVDPNFISENLNVRKLELQNRPPSSTGSAIRYRRDYAFAY